MFQIKDFASIVAAQINHARSVTSKITDFQPGSVARTLMEAPAVEVEELYLQMFLGLRDAIPVATFLSFGFELLPASYAFGYVSVSKSPAPTAPSTVPIGTVFSTADGRTYASTAAVVWPIGQSIIHVPVQSSVIGLAGNAAIGVITASPAFGVGYTISNSAIESGKDPETDAEREARFAEFIQSLSRGTVSACIYAAKQSVVLSPTGGIAEYVTRASIYEDGGHVRIYLYSNTGVPSAELLADGQLRIDGSRDPETGAITPGYRSAGVRVDVLPMAERLVLLSINVGMLSGYTLNAGVTQALGDVFASQIVAVQPDTTLYLGSLTEALLAVPGVQTVVPLTNENIVCATGEALIPGALTITAI